MSKRKTRERQLAKLAARRAAERRRRRRQRILAGAVAAAVFLAGGVVAFLAFTGGGKEHKKPRAHRSPTPAVSPSPSPPAPSISPGTGKQTGTVKPQPAPGEVACGAKAPATADDSKPQFDGPPPFDLDRSVTYIASIQTSCGTFKVELLPRTAPQTVNSFVFLAKQHYFDGTYFHRIADELDVIQGGDPTGSGGGGPGYNIPDELKGDETYPPGTLAMANTGAPDSGGSQFFVITGPHGHNLDSNNVYTVFGRITEGLDVAQKIQGIQVQGFDAGDSNADGPPTQAIYIEKVTIKPVAPSTPGND